MDTESIRFGHTFTWGVASSAYQTEGSAPNDGRGVSIWDHFSGLPGKIRDGHHAREAVDFYHLFEQDLGILRAMGFRHFRFSFSWPRIFPSGTGKVNQNGVDFYHKLLAICHKMGIEPWMTVYHWDLPLALEKKGGWANREVLKWFEDYATFCAKEYGYAVKNWIVLNEPSAFTGFGYFTGYHAPGHRSLIKFLASIHHAGLCQRIGYESVKKNVNNARVGTSLATFALAPYRQDNEQDLYAIRRMDAMLNRLYMEPILGLGYPWKDFEPLYGLKLFIQKGDMEKLPCDFDFVGLQYYCRLTGKFSLWPPFVYAREIPARQRGLPVNNMGYEIYPEGLYEVLKKAHSYNKIKCLMVTECGISLDDRLESNGEIHDEMRTWYYRSHLQQLLRAKQEGIPVDGFFAWTLTDNFEWAEGYHPRFGLVYVDHATQQRHVKDSGHWFAGLLGAKNPVRLF